MKVMGVLLRSNPLLVYLRYDFHRGRLQPTPVKWKKMIILVHVEK